MKFTPDQIAQLAPDAASDKAGQKLAVSTKWPKLCQNERALWGECQGSGKKPYKTVIDLNVLAFKCSCPSRKFPCKHAIGLLYLHASGNAPFSEADLEPHVAEWLESRANRAEKASKKAEEKEKKPVDAAAQQKRQQAREKKVALGVEELRVWIKDRIRTGIMNVPQEQYHFANNIIARMVDAQANGLAGQLRTIEAIPYYKEGWDQLLLQKLSKLYLITEAYQHMEQLNPEWQQEIKKLIGWSHSKEEVLALPPVRDQWLAWSRTLENDNNLMTERIWLYGLKSKRYALLLNFYANNQVNSTPWSSGQVVEADVCFYPALSPLRILIKERYDSHPLEQLYIEAEGLQALQQHHAEVLTQNPFADRVPMLIADLRLSRHEDRFYLQDQEGCTSQLDNSETECWVMYSISGGESFDAFLIKENDRIQIHALFINQQLYAIKWA